MGEAHLPFLDWKTKTLTEKPYVQKNAWRGVQHCNYKVGQLHGMHKSNTCELSSWWVQPMTRQEQTPNDKRDGKYSILREADDDDSR